MIKQGSLLIGLLLSSAFVFAAEDLTGTLEKFVGKRVYLKGKADQGALIEREEYPKPIDRLSPSDRFISVMDLNSPQKLIYGSGSAKEWPRDSSGERLIGKVVYVSGILKVEANYSINSGGNKIPLPGKGYILTHAQFALHPQSAQNTKPPPR